MKRYVGQRAAGHWEEVKPDPPVKFVKGEVRLEAFTGSERGHHVMFSLTKDDLVNLLMKLEFEEELSNHMSKVGHHIRVARLAEKKAERLEAELAKLEGTTKQADDSAA